MSDPAPARITPICAEKQALGETYLKAVRVVNELLEAQAATVLAKGSDLDRVAMALTLAREERDRAKTAYAAHIQAHGC